jgi:hypothetical protein
MVASFTRNDGEDMDPSHQTLLISPLLLNASQPVPPYSNFV